MGRAGLPAFVPFPAGKYNDISAAGRETDKTESLNNAPWKLGHSFRSWTTATKNASASGRGRESERGGINLESRESTRMGICKFTNTLGVSGICAEESLPRSPL